MTHRLTSPQAKMAGLACFILLMCLSFLASIRYGATSVSWQSVWEAYTNPSGTTEELIVLTTRTPRALTAAATGGSLAVAGALLQALTRNPLASPGIFGMNAGAALCVVWSVSFLSIKSYAALSWIAFAGAGLSSLLVYLLGSMGADGMTPIKVTLAGAALTAFFSSVTSGVLVIDEQALDTVLAWLAGSVSGSSLDMLAAVSPFLAAAWIAAFVLARPVTTLMLGEDVAKGLGQHTPFVKAAVFLVVTLLTGGSVAVAGPITLIGLVIPHVARYLVGINHLWVLPYCFLLGSSLLLLGDVAVRFIIPPEEVPVGALTALIGVPFFVHIARKGGWQL